MGKQRVYVLIFSSILADKTINYNEHLLKPFFKVIRKSLYQNLHCHSKASLYRAFGPRYMSLKCNDREGQERHFQAGKAEPGGPRCTTLALRQLENLCFFIQIICWVPLISFSFRALGSLNNDSDERFT